MYRDERDALRQRVEKLERDLEEAREHPDPAVQHRADELAAEAERMESQLTSMRRELAELRGPGPARPSSPSSRTLVAVGVALLIVGGSAASWIALARSDVRAPNPAPFTPVAPVPEPAPVPAPEPAPVPVPEPEPAPEPAPAPPAEDGRGTLTWSASVVRAKGLALAPRTKCLVTAEVNRARKRATTYDTGLHIHCGAVVVYDTDQALGGGMISEQSVVTELPGPAPGVSVYTLRRSDSGPRHGERPELDLDSVKGKLVAWRGGVSELRVELKMDAVSRPAPPLSLARERLERAGKVESASAGAPFKAGAPCSVRVVFNESCLVRLDCGGVALANTAIGQCVEDDVALTHVSVGDPSPSFDVDTREPTSTVSSHGKKPWEATIKWDSAP
ncbi:MAG TPA: hypothetical protein VGM56_00135 [Byssovorax sp.]|jgi:hypothetical protein